MRLMPSGGQLTLEIGLSSDKASSETPAQCWLSVDSHCLSMKAFCASRSTHAHKLIQRTRERKNTLLCKLNSQKKEDLQ